MKNGFTLAEVLLTLAIIGVVAALTIPAVITKVTQDQYVVGLKKAYNTLKSVQREAEQEHGPVNNWAFSRNSADFDKYFRSHFDILKDCGATTDNGCVPDGWSYMDDSNTWMPNVNTSASVTKIVTSDGIAYAYAPVASSSGKERVANFWVDVNGNKGPNKMGKDAFIFNVFPEMGIKPCGLYEMDGVTSWTTSEYAEWCKKTGSTCAAKVLAEGAMNY